MNYELMQSRFGVHVICDWLDGDATIPVKTKKEIDFEPFPVTMEDGETLTIYDRIVSRNQHLLRK